MQKRSESSAGRAASAASQETVEQVAAYLRANIDVPIRLSTLCEVAGLSERALREAFYHVHGMSPKRWMLAQRLQNVRRTLTNREAAPISVTGVATKFGFYELGRFAASYKEAFGETPSVTLRGAIGKSATAYAEGHTDVCTK